MDFFPVQYARSPEYGAQPLWWKYVYLRGVALGEQTLFYTGFAFMESYCISSGLGYSPPTEEKEETYNKIR